MRRGRLCGLFCCVLLAVSCVAAPLKKTPPEPSALDKYIAESMSHDAPSPVQASAGSLWTPSSRITDLGSDLRAIQVNDLVTIVVAEQASAVVNGATQTSRKSSAAAAVTGLAGLKSATSA